MDMKLVRVNTEAPYDVEIGHGILSECGKRIRERTKALSAAVIADENVSRLYGDIVKKSLEEADFRVVTYTFKPGEDNKSMNTVCDILEFLAAEKLTRSDIVVALGGGIAGDMAGFCASSYLRGIDFVQLPTTLLAAVDSSVGGKTGVNLRAGKNLAGAFHQPIYVLCDCDCFDTLPYDILTDGISESIKYGVIFDRELFYKLKNGDIKEHIMEIVARCVQLKADVVERDTLDKGERQLLNLGHTFGHAIEKCSNYSISHGHAVAIGMVYAARAALKLGILDDANAVDEIIEVLKKYSLPISTDIEREKLLNVMLNDKKRSGDSINLVLPESIGHSILKNVHISQLKEVF